MKTIWDAVNELKGDLRGVCASIKRDEIWRNNESDTYIAIKGNPYHRPEIYTFACTVEEFNGLVAEMSLGLDVNKVTNGEHYDYVNSDKELLKPIKQDSIYTQEMYDNGERPSVGMKVSLEEDTEFFSCASGEVKQLKANDVVSVISVGKRLDNKYTVLTLMDVDAGFCVINPDYVKPIPPKLELIDGKAYQFDISATYDKEVSGIYSELKSTFSMPYANIHISKCTNIKLLTVSD